MGVSVGLNGIKFTITSRPRSNSPSSNACASSSFTPPSTQYSIIALVRARVPAARYASSAAMIFGSGYAVAVGTIFSLKAWFGACSESARRTSGESRASASIFGTTPTVETVTRLGATAKPRASDKRPRDAHTAS